MLKQRVVQYFRGTRLGVTFCRAESTAPNFRERYAKDNLNTDKPYHVTFYDVETLDDFETLTPSLAQRMYIIQLGLNYLQAAKANALITFAEDQSEYIDLLNAINEPPSIRKIEKSSTEDALQSNSNT